MESEDLYYGLVSDFTYDIQKNVYEKINTSFWTFFINHKYISATMTKHDIIGKTAVQFEFENFIKKAVLCRFAVYAKKMVGKHMKAKEEHIHNIFKKLRKNLASDKPVPDFDDLIHRFHFSWDKRKEMKEKEDIHIILEKIIKIVIPYIYHYGNIETIIKKMKDIIQYHLNNVFTVVQSTKEISTLIKDITVKKFNEIAHNIYTEIRIIEGGSGTIKSSRKYISSPKNSMDIMKEEENERGFSQMEEKDDESLIFDLEH